MRYTSKTINLLNGVRERLAMEEIDLNIQAGVLLALGDVVFVDGTVVLHPINDNLVEIFLYKYNVSITNPPLIQLGLDGRMQLNTSTAIEMAINEVLCEENNPANYVGLAPVDNMMRHAFH